MGDFLSEINVDILGALDAECLPEADRALLAAIKQAAPLKTKHRDYQILYTKNLLAARYATASIYKELMEDYKTSEKGWLEDSCGALLAYFTKHNAAEGIRLIDERIGKLVEDGDSNIFYSITKMGFPQELKKYLQKRLATDIPGAVGNAAYRLAKYGGRKNRKLIEARYARWLQEWQERRAKLDDPQTDPKIRRQSIVQINLIESLINAKSWRLSEMEIKQLKLLCVTQHCRQFFSIRHFRLSRVIKLIKRVDQTDFCRLQMFIYRRPALFCPFGMLQQRSDKYSDLRPQSLAAFRSSKRDNRKT